MRVGNCQPFDDYRVKPQWVAMLLQGGKIDLETGRLLYVRCGVNASHHVADLDLLRREETLAQMDQYIAHVWEALRETRRPMKTYPAVQSWLGLFAQQAYRRPFLVLHGPSAVGKSIFARSLAEQNNCPFLAVNMSGGILTPDLRAFRFGHHKFVILEEASVDAVLHNKLLVQGCAMVIQLGQTTTSRWGYPICTHGVRFVITSNKWVAEAAQVDDPDDRAWLDVNAIVVVEEERCWSEEWDAWY